MWRSKLLILSKATFLIVIFIALSTLLAVYSGLTQELSKLFYYPLSGQVAGEYTVRIAQASLPLLGIQGDRFTINGTPTFLRGVSYFDAINYPSETVLIEDLNFLRDNHFNLIRVWADWSWQNNEESSSPPYIPAPRNSTVFNLDGSLNTFSY